VGKLTVLRIINLALMLSMLVGVFALYAIKYDARQLEARIQMQERDLEKLENNVAVLIAERAHLARPKALEPLARNLGLAPIAPRQYLRLDAPAVANAVE
jgi:cell division protein FtsL